MKPKISDHEVFLHQFPIIIVYCWEFFYDNVFAKKKDFEINPSTSRSIIQFVRDFYDMQLIELSGLLKFRICSICISDKSNL